MASGVAANNPASTGRVMPDIQRDSSEDRQATAQDRSQGGRRSGRWGKGGGGPRGGEQPEPVLADTPLWLAWAAFNDGSPVYEGA